MKTYLLTEQQKQALCDIAHSLRGHVSGLDKKTVAWECFSGDLKKLEALIEHFLEAD
jgi:hypothetical protein